jgi:hypothetical protein
MTPEMLATYLQLGGEREPLKRWPRELWFLMGRRSGKDFVSARIVAYLTLLVKWTLATGEVGVFFVLAVDRTQARIFFRYFAGLLQSDDSLAAEIESVTADVIVLKNGIEIQIGTSDNAAVRGRTLIGALLDEVCFWAEEDLREVLRGLRPAMATQPKAILIAISSVYRRKGPSYENAQRYYGQDNPQVFVARGETRMMNPTITQEFIDAEIARDPIAAAAEYLSQERSDLEDFIDLTLVERAQRKHTRELPKQLHLPNGTPIQYFAGIDVSGGKRDGTAAAISFRDGGRVRIAAARLWPSPHDPSAVAKEVAAFLAEFGLTSARSDQYGAELRVAIYRDAGVSLIDSELNRSELYLHMLPLFTADRIEIPDDPRLTAELVGLERRTGRSGKDAVDHAPNRRDDFANAVALAAWAATKTSISDDAGQNVATVIPSRSMSGYADVEAIRDRHLWEAGHRPW